jgi:hypothetical protein
MSKKAKIAISTTLGLLSVFLYLYVISPVKIAPATSTTQLVPTKETNKNLPSPTELSFIAREQDTVYGFMEKLKKEGKINFVDKTYSGMGKLILSINGQKSNGNKTWIYYVNGKEANVGISNYQIKPGDIVSWKYESVHY